MLDALVAILASTLPWHSSPTRVRPMGVPFMLASLFFCMATDLLPDTMLVYDWSCSTVVTSSLLVCVVDLLQWASHLATHKMWFGRRVYQSHMIHHRHTVPTVDTAFETGWTDALLQLILPLVIWRSDFFSR